MKRYTIAALLPLAACANEKLDLPSGNAAYSSIPAPAPGNTVRNYIIGPLDVMNVTVFQEPDLTVKDVQVDATGRVLLPLVGEMRAGGLTANELAHQIATQLSVRYLENPQVAVVISSSASQRVTVEGSVTDPGVFEIRGRTTLLDALAMAKGPTRVARINEVVVFRDINGQHTGAVFDVSAIRTGRMPDPEILGNDTVVVGFSNVKAAWRDFLSTAPLIAIFRPFG